MMKSIPFSIILCFCLNVLETYASLIGFSSQNSYLLNNEKFDEFKKKYQKTYLSESENRYRSLILQKNLNYIQAANEEAEGQYFLEMNFFADLSPQQFNLLYASSFFIDEEIEEIVLNQDNSAKTYEQRESFQQSKSQFFEQNSNQIKQVLQKKITEKKLAKETLDRKIQNMPRNDVLLAQYGSQNSGEAGLELENQNRILSSASNSAPNSQNRGKNTKENLQNNLARQQETQLAIYNTDWTTFTGVVRDQGQCGACYAFTAVQHLETLLAANRFNLHIELSVQQFIDCAVNQFSFGCEGGHLQGPFNYLKDIGVTTEFVYPYVSGSNKGQKQTCKNKEGQFRIKSYREIKKGDCMAVREALKDGPLSVGISSYRLQFYKEGVVDFCGDKMDHSVLLVGYDSSKGWRIKNSWGTKWGQKGFIWLKDGNTCQICNAAITATV